MPPAYYNYDDNEVINFYTKIINALPDVEIILYNFEKLCGYKFSVSCVKELVKRFPDQIAGVKDSSYNLYENLNLNTNGKLNILNDSMTLDSKAYFKTTKYKDLPAVGIRMVGASASPEVSYDLSELKQKIFNEGVKKILNEKKSITINPDEIKKLFDQKKIDPNKIIDLFVN